MSVAEIMSREVELDLQVSPQEIMSREVELGCEMFDFFRFELFLNSSATDIVLVTRSAQSRQLKQQLRSALVAGQWRRDTALTLPLFWRRSTVSDLFRAVSAVEPSLCRPLPTLSSSLIGHLASVDVKQQ